MSFAFLKKKSVWITLAIVVIGGGLYWRSRSANQGPFFDTAKVEQTDLFQTVEVTGEIKPDARIGLSFKAGGTIESIGVKIGQTVKRGDVLAQVGDVDTRLSISRAAASLAIAQANLNARLAGETKESIQISQASVDQAQASYDKAVSDLAITKQQVENEYQVSVINLNSAEKALANTGATADQSVIATFQNFRSALQGSLGSMRTALVDGDNIIGIDDTAANDSYEGVLSLQDSGAKEGARSQYLISKPLVADAETAVRALKDTSSYSDIRAAGVKVRTALDAVQTYLDYVKRALAASITNAYLTDSVLASKKATIDGDRATVSTQLSTIVSNLESTKTSELSQQSSKDQAQSSYDTAKANLAVADSNRTLKVKAAETSVAVQLAALNSAKASLAQRKAPPRDVDVAGLRAQVQEASVALQQAQTKLGDLQITAPTDGIVTDILPAAGEQIAPNVIAINMIGTEQYTIESLVPEADITKVSVGQDATITLDAFGDNVKFKGKVIAENPDQTKVQDAIYYKVYVTVEAENRDIKPGMTANLIIHTDERKNVLIIPSRAIRQTGEERSVRILEGNEPKEMKITTGLRGDEGLVEVTSGLQAGQDVITGELTAQEYAQKQAEAATKK